MDAAQTLGDRHAEAQLLNFTGWARKYTADDLDGARYAHERALSLAVEAGDRLEQAWAHAYLCTILAPPGDLAGALEHIEQAILLSAGFDFWGVQMPVRSHHVLILRSLGRPAEALSVQQGLISDAEQRLGRTAPRTRLLMLAMARREVGHCLHDLGRWREAAEVLADVRRVFDELGSAELSAQAALHEGRVWRDAGDAVRAYECFQVALTTYREHGLPAARSQVLDELARLERR